MLAIADRFQQRCIALVVIMDDHRELLRIQSSVAHDWLRKVPANSASIDESVKSGYWRASQRTDPSKLKTVCFFRMILAGTGVSCFTSVQSVQTSGLVFIVTYRRASTRLCNSSFLEMSSCSLCCAFQYPTLLPKLFVQIVPAPLTVGCIGASSTLVS